MCVGRRPPALSIRDSRGRMTPSTGVRMYVSIANQVTTKMWLRISVSVALSSAVLAFGTQARIGAQDRFAPLERVVASELDRTKTPGAIVAVIEQDKISYVH